MPLSIVTGATGGLGYATAEGLARAGHRVVLTGRSAAKGQAAVGRLSAAVPGAEVRFELLDMASLDSIADFAARGHDPVDLLVNNAGVMGFPRRQLTADGFEAQFGTNHLGHFALTGRLLQRLLSATQPRVVTVASLAHRRARLNFDDLQGEQSYEPLAAYAQSKLANLTFARTLQKRAARHGWKLASIAAHPGWSATRIVLNGMGTGLRGRLIQRAFNALAQSAAQGARPMLYAALSADAEPGGYYGPAWLGETRGPVKPSWVAPQAQDEQAAERLWSASETLTGVTIPPRGG